MDSLWDSVREFSIIVSLPLGLVKLGQKIPFARVKLSGAAAAHKEFLSARALLFMGSREQRRSYTLPFQGTSQLSSARIPISMRKPITPIRIMPTITISVS